MPFRHAHWALLLLAPVIALAFWPQYFGKLPDAPFAFHAHAVTASAWLILVAWQAWTIQQGKRALHRASGAALLVVVPLFVGGGVLAMCSMAVKYATASHPFYAVLGPQLGLHDVIATTMLVAMVRAALVARRRIALHAGYMLSTVLLVLPPVVERLPLLPRGLHVSEGAAIVAALVLWWLSGKGNGRPFLIVVAVMIVQIVQFETIGASAAWGRAFARLADVPPFPLALAAMIASAIILWSAWPRPLVATPRAAA